jgi:hypothetical protein
MKDDLAGNDKLVPLRAVTLMIILTGALASIALTLRAGHNNRSVTLMSLFAVWVLSPFIMLLIASVAFKGWSYSARITVCILALFVTIGSLIGYSGIIGQFGPKPAFVFLFIPLISWMLLVIAYFIVKSKKKRGK